MPFKDLERKKAYFKQYNKERYQKNLAYYEQKRQERKNAIRALKSVPCAECGISYPWYVMEFDHIQGDKIDAVSNLLRDSSLEIALAETKKCEVVCANCHAIRTYERSIQNG